MVIKTFVNSFMDYLPNARFRPFVGERLFVLGVVGGLISPKRNGGRYPTLGLPEGECVGLPRVIGSIAEGWFYVKIRNYVFETQQSRSFFVFITFYKNDEPHGCLTARKFQKTS